MPIVVDLNTKILAAGQKTFMIRPGANYHLFDAFAQESVVAPDIPFLSVPNGVRPIDYGNLDAEIRRGRAVREWARTEETRSQAFPDIALRTYQNAENAGQHGRFVSVVEEILWGLPADSLIYVPNMSLYQDALFGELAKADDARPIFNGPGHLALVSYQGRSLLNARRMPARDLPYTILQSKKKNTTVVEIEGRDRLLLYRKFYGDFEILGERSLMELSTTKPRFTASDATVIGALTTMVHEAWQRKERGENTVPSLLEAAFMDIGDNAPNIHANINSPGKLLVESSTRAAHIVKLLVVLCLAIDAPELQGAALAQSIEVENSQRAAGMPDVTEVETREFLFHFLRNAGANDVEQIVANVRKLHDRTGGQVDAKVDRRP